MPFLFHLANDAILAFVVYRRARCLILCLNSLCNTLQLIPYVLRFCQELYGIAIDEQRIIEVFFVFPYEIRQILRLFDSFGVVLDPSFEVVGHILDLIQRFLPKIPIRALVGYNWHLISLAVRVPPDEFERFRIFSLHCVTYFQRRTPFFEARIPELCQPLYVRF